MITLTDSAASKVKELLETVYVEKAIFPLIESMGKRLEEEVKVRAELRREDAKGAVQRLEKHLAECDACTAYVEQFRTTIALTGRSWWRCSLWRCTNDTTRVTDVKTNTAGTAIRARDQVRARPAASTQAAPTNAATAVARKRPLKRTPRGRAERPARVGRESKRSTRPR